jgi:hypothetical protein
MLHVATREPEATAPSTAAPAAPGLAEPLVDPLTAPAQNGPPRQKVGSLDQIYAQAREALPDFQSKVSQVASSTKGTPSFPPAPTEGGGSGAGGALDEDDRLGLKGKNRANEKIAADYTDKDGNADVARLVDVVRGSVVYNTMEDLEAGKKAIASKFKVVREKDRFQKGKDQDGYRDVNYNLETENGHIAEVQLHLQQILDAKSGKGELGHNEAGRSGHKIYEDLRVLEAKKKEGFPDIADPAQKAAQIESTDKRISELKAESRAHYDKALKAAGGKITGD